MTKTLKEKSYTGLHTENMQETKGWFMSLLEKIHSDFIREIGAYSIKMPIFAASLIRYSPSSFILYSASQTQTLSKHIRLTEAIFSREKLLR